MNSYFKKILFTFSIAIFLVGCKSKNINNSKTSFYKDEVFACYYHNKFNGRKTANGDVFSNNKLTAAHKTLKFGTKLKLTNKENNKSVVVTVNDRGPFSKKYEVDLSQKAFLKIADDLKKGKVKVLIEILP